MIRCSFIVLWALLGSVAAAAEITSNGLGGGLWSDPASWHGGKVPAAGDDVVVRKLDTITFDRDDDGKISCQKVQLDPRGLLQFKTGAGRITLVVADAVESYGAIKMDGTRSAKDLLELRLVGTEPAKRQLKLGKGAGLLLYGKPGLEGGKRNVLLTAVLAEDKKETAVGAIDIDGQVALDLQRAQLRDIKVFARKLDNTGARPNEKLQIIDCLFLGQARVLCHTCDTPMLLKNSFLYEGDVALTEPAMNVLYSPLAEIKQNRIKGKFAIGIAINYQTDTSVVDNEIEHCAVGIQGGYGIPNTMIRQARITGCEHGIKLEGATGVVEEAVITRAKTALTAQNVSLQYTSVVLKELDPKGVGLDYQGGTVTVLNCSLLPAQIKYTAPAAPAKEFAVLSQQYLVVAVPEAPEGTVVQLRTAGLTLPPDVADPNVRNSPAPLLQGLTPLPRTFNPLIVRSWALDPKGMLQPAPEYQIAVLGPAPKEGVPRPVLKMLTYRPTVEVFRPALEDETPTLKVPLK